MRLAEALSLRADLQRKLRQLASRIQENVIIDEDDEPLEDIEQLFKELNQTSIALENMIYRINKTNLLVEVDGKNITSIMAHREVESKRISILRDAISVASRCDRFRSRDVKEIRMINVSQLRAEVDKASANLRKLDLKIQEINWTIDLLD